MNRSRHISIRTKVLAGFLLVVLLGSAAHTATLLVARRDALLRETDARLLMAARYAQAIAGAEYHDRLGERPDEEEEAFAHLVERYNQACLELGLQYLWSVMVLDGQIVFTSATHSDPSDPASPRAGYLEVHRDPDAFRQALQSDRPVYSTFDNEWGEGRMVLVPGRDAQGRTYVYGASKQLHAVAGMVRATLIEGALFSMGILVVAVAFSLVLAGRLSVPIVRLTKAAQRLAGGDLDTELRSTGPREVAVLTESINAMRRAIRREMSAVCQSEAKFRALIEQIPAITYTAVWDGELTNLYISPQVRELLGGQPEQWISHPWPGLHEEDRQRVRDELEQARLGNRPFLSEYRMVTPDGRTLWFRDEGRFLEASSDGQLVLQGVMTDVSHRKEMESQLRKRLVQLQRLTSQLTLAEERQRERLALLLHDDLQQLLVGVKIRLDAAGQDLPEGKVREALKQCSQFLLEAVQTTRSLSKQLSPPLLQERGLPAGLRWLGSRMEEIHRLHVTVDVDETADPGCEDHRVLLFRAVQELLLNVAKHAGVDSARVRLKRRAECIEVQVVDEGAGFDAAAHFSDASMDGLGLASILERLELLGGSMNVRSTPGGGCRVSLNVPVTSPDMVCDNSTDR